LQKCSSCHNEDKLALDVLIGGQEIRSPSYCSLVMIEVAGLLLVSVVSCRVCRSQVWTFCTPAVRLCDVIRWILGLSHCSG